MEELAVRYQRAYPDTVFVSWVKEIQQFCELDLMRTLAQRGHGIVYLRANQTTSADSSEVTAEDVQTKSLVSRQAALRFAKSGFRRAAKLSPRLANKLERELQQRYLRQHKQAEFTAGDQLFIPWGEWWDPNFITKLEQIHTAGGLIIQVLHDMAPVVVPQFSNSGNATETFPVYCRRILPICDLVVCVSENSRQDALKWLKDNRLPVPTIEVFRLGDDIQIAQSLKPDVSQIKGKLQGDYILMVGTIELKKNHQLLYYVYKLAKARGIDLPPVVIAGRLGWMTEATVELMTKDPEVKDKLIFILGPSDEELSWLYDHCLFTVLPSLYEGWGIPIAESVSRGVPCLCSDTSSMTEIAEGYVEHFNPNSTDECLAGIQKWLDPKQLAAARQRVAKYKQYSWDDSFAQVDEYVKEIA